MSLSEFFDHLFDGVESPPAAGATGKSACGKEGVFPQNLPAAVVEKVVFPEMAHDRDLSALLHCLVSEHVNRTYRLQDDKKFVKRCR